MTHWVKCKKKSQIDQSNSKQISYSIFPKETCNFGQWKKKSLAIVKKKETFHYQRQEKIKNCYLFVFHYYLSECDITSQISKYIGNFWKLWGKQDDLFNYHKENWEINQD